MRVRRVAVGWSLRGRRVWAGLGFLLVAGGLLGCAARTPPRLEMEMGPEDEWSNLVALVSSSVTATVRMRSEKAEELEVAGEIEGVVVEVDREGLELSGVRAWPGRPGRDIGTLRVPRGAVRSVTVPGFREDPTGDGALEGMAIGAAGLGFLGFVAPDAAPAFGFVLAAVGGGLGALWGWHVDRSHLEQGVVTVYRAPGR